MELANPKSKHICNSHKPTHRPKIAKELTPLPPKEKLFFKISFPSKIFKTATHSRHKQTHSQLDNDSETHSRQGLYNLDRQKASL